jgi:hypothetical protein
MREYKLYLLDDKDHIRSAVDLECEDDKQAIRLAKASLNAPMELWQGSRKIKKFEPAGARRAAR